MRNFGRFDGADDRVVTLASVRRPLPLPALGRASGPAADVLRVGGTGAHPPFSFPDPATGEPRGIAIDLITAVAADLGLALQSGAVLPAGSAGASLAVGTIDILADAVPITPDRPGAAAMTIPWYVGSGEGVWVRRRASACFRSIADFRGRVVGALAGSTLAEALAERAAAFAEIRLYDGPARLAKAVREQEVAGGVLDGVAAAYALFQRRHPDLVIPRDYQASLTIDELYGFAFAAGAAGHVPRFNAALARLMVNGTVTRIFAAYGLVWPVRAG